MTRQEGSRVAEKAIRFTIETQRHRQRPGTVGRDRESTIATLTPFRTIMPLLLVAYSE
jgi:hypothetical protein